MITDDEIDKLHKMATAIFDEWRGEEYQEAKGEIRTARTANLILELIRRLRLAEEALRVCQSLNQALRDREAAEKTKGATDERPRGATKMTDNKKYPDACCQACGTVWSVHLGIEGTCARLIAAKAALSACQEVFIEVYDTLEVATDDFIQAGGKAATIDKCKKARREITHAVVKIIRAVAQGAKS